MAVVDPEDVIDFPEPKPLSVLERGMFPRRFWESDFKMKRTQENADAIDTMRAFDGGRNVFLSGAPGSGKTRLACAAIRTLNRPAKFYDTAKLLLDFQCSVEKHGEKDLIREITDKVLKDKKILVFDDLGAHRISEFSVEMFGILVNEFYNQEATGLIFTSNFTLGELSMKMSDRITSRLAEMCVVLKTGTTDYRTNKAEAQK